MGPVCTVEAGLGALDLSLVLLLPEKLSTMVFRLRSVVKGKMLAYLLTDSLLFTCRATLMWKHCCCSCEIPPFLQASSPTLKEPT